MNRETFGKLYTFGLVIIFCILSIGINNIALAADSTSNKKGNIITAIIDGYSDIHSVGDVLSLKQEYTTTQNISYQWYRSTTHTHLNFTGADYKAPYEVQHEFEGSIEAITGAINETYTLTADDIGFYIFCEMKGDGSVFVTDSLIFPVTKSLLDVKIERSGNKLKVVLEPEGAEIVEYQWFRRGVPSYWKDTGEELTVKTGSTKSEYTISEGDTTWLDIYEDKYDIAGNRIEHNLLYTPKAYYIGVEVLANGNKRIQKFIRIK